MKERKTKTNIAKQLWPDIRHGLCDYQKCIEFNSHILTELSHNLEGGAKTNIA